MAVLRVKQIFHRGEQLHTFSHISGNHHVHHKEATERELVLIIVELLAYETAIH